MSTDELFHLLALLEDSESGQLEKQEKMRLVRSFMKMITTYRADAALLANLELLVTVDLVETDLRELGGEFLEDRRDHAAGATPSSPEVDDDGLVAVDLKEDTSIYDGNTCRVKLLTSSLNSLMELIAWTDMMCDLKEI